jgi:hypothetical protein
MRQALFTILAAIFIPASAFAVDGVVLINQSTVMAAGGFPYTISQSGSYKLSGNLTVPANSSGIMITASSVILDLNGFSVAGSAQFEIGIAAASGVSGVTIRNGNVTGFAFGVLPPQSVPPAPSWTLQDLYLDGGFGGVAAIFVGSFSRIVNVTAPDLEFRVNCPSVVSFSTAYVISLANPNATNCTFFGNATVQ